MTLLTTKVRRDNMVHDCIKESRVLSLQELSSAVNGEAFWTTFILRVARSQRQLDGT